MEFMEFRERLRDEAPEHVFDLWFEREDKIWEKYKLTEWQQIAYNNALKEAFLKEISIITFPNEIKNRLKIKDENIANSISLDTAIHVFSLAKDYFRYTDNLIKSLGGEEEYWKKYSPNYWNEIKVAEPLITVDDMKNAYNIAEKEVSKAEDTLKELEKSNLRDVIPKTYNQIFSHLKEVKAKLDSENYDLILESEGLAKRLIEGANEAKNKALNNQKNIPRIIEIEKELEERKVSCLRNSSLAKIYLTALFIGLICFIQAIRNFSGSFYLMFAIISGMTRQFIECHVENDNSFMQKIVGFVFGFIAAPLYLLDFLKDIEILKNIKNRGVSQADLKEELAKINRELE